MMKHSTANHTLNSHNFIHIHLSGTVRAHWDDEDDDHWDDEESDTLRRDGDAMLTKEGDISTAHGSRHDTTGIREAFRMSLFPSPTSAKTLMLREESLTLREREDKRAQH